MTRADGALESVTVLSVCFLGACALVFGFLWIHKNIDAAVRKREKKEHGSVLQHLDKMYKELREAEDPYNVRDK